MIILNSWENSRGGGGSGIRGSQALELKRIYRSYVFMDSNDLL